MSAMDELIAEHEGDALLALIALADTHGIGIAYVNRALIDSHLESDKQEVLSDEEWSELQPLVGGTNYDDYISHQGDLERQFIKAALQEANVQRDH